MGRDAENPWLRIPAADYEAHMALPEVGQAQALDALFRSALEEHAPESLAVLGCSTGNGFEHIDPARTRRVVGVDIHPEYPAVLDRRYRARIPVLELIEADFTAPDFRIEPVSMVFAGLVFEYVRVRDALRAVERSLSPGGILAAVLQLPSAESAPVSDTPYRSLERLAPILKLVSPDAFTAACAEVGLLRSKAATVPLLRGKAFFAGFYRKGGASS